jgi:hypothetical protein
MREILFRGKAEEGQTLNGVSGFWEFGHLVKWANQYFIMDENCNWDISESGTRVIPKTIGQFIGLLDKNGKKIFEGDIVRIEDFANAVVKWREDIACWTLQGYIIGNTWDSSMLEVIGNIHDNPELLS